ncbi:MAG: UDP-N-acetylmuramoyl-L-alanine--D-glutamate ligase [Anaerolineales bacterium]
MKTTKWQGKHLVILGAARQGLALARYLSKQGVRITITDQKDEEALMTVMEEYRDSEISWALGGHPLELLDDADGLALSGGVPLDIPIIQEARRRGIPLTNDSQVFLELVPCPVIGITGSAGKTTTTTLVGRIAKTALGEDHAWVGGNIGNPLISDLERIKPGDLAVLELSSFQTELMDVSPEVACILNITPNHLDRHGTMEAYSEAKARILEFQGPNDVAVLNREDPGSWRLRDRVRGDLTSFGREIPSDGLRGTYLEGDWINFWDGSRSQPLVPVQDIKLRGEHNLMNVLAACAIAKVAGLPGQAMQQGVASLTGVEHRLEPVRTWKGIEWINDSKATTPQGSIAAIKSFQEPIVLLAGGRDKDLPWADFARLVQERVKAVILFGEAAGLIERALLSSLGAGEKSRPYWICSSLREAVGKAAQVAEAGDVVLLSPGGTSFDEFNDFEDRGRMYKKWVSELN